MNESLGAEHERLGRIVMEIIARYASALDDIRVCSEAAPGDLAKIFNEDLPIDGIGAEEILKRFEQDVMPHSMQVPSPRYFGLFNPTPLPISVWADALASAINQNGAAWRNSPAASVIETRVLKWLCEIIGYAAQSFGTLTSGGSEANLVALKCARDRAAENVRECGLRAAHGDMIVYASEQCHYSFEKSVDILGMGRASLRKIAVDDNFHIRVDELREQIELDLHAGKIICCIAGAAGATSTGIIDPLDQLADVARAYKCWFHVDGAYGGALAFSGKHKKRLRGIERANSVTIDPHKWMFVPFACGAVLVRDGGRVLRDGFDITPEYLNEQREHLGGADVEYDFLRYGQLGTRRFNALKLWMAIKFLGVRGYAEIIERQIELTKYFARRLDEAKEFTRVGQVETAVCCFRFTPLDSKTMNDAAQDDLQRALQQRIERSGEAWVSTTVLKNRRVLRVNVNSFLTERRHIDDLIELLRREGAGLVKGA